MGSWAVDLALCVGIFPYVLKLLQTSASELRECLIFIWTKIFALDPTCYVSFSTSSFKSFPVSLTHLLRGLESYCLEFKLCKTWKVLGIKGSNIQTCDPQLLQKISHCGNCSKCSKISFLKVWPSTPGVFCLTIIIDYNFVLNGTWVASARTACRAQYCGRSPGSFFQSCQGSLPGQY